jgi:hypothetical protein
VPSSNDETIILADTNVVYKLYFFVSTGVVPSRNIIIKNLGIVEFHPIVKVEVEAQTVAWRLSASYGIKGYGDWPAFFDLIGDKEVKKIEEFVENNISTRDVNVDTGSKAFLLKKKIYEKERMAIQKAMQEQGRVGRKVISVPSDNDYSVLYSAEIKKFKIVTNDEILLKVAEEFLDADQTLKAEDVLKVIYNNDIALESKIKETIETLDSLGEVITISRIFSKS